VPVNCVQKVKQGITEEERKKDRHTREKRQKQCLVSNGEIIVRKEISNAITHHQYIHTYIYN